MKLIYNIVQQYKMKRMQLFLLFTLLLVCAHSLNGIGLNPIKPYHLNKGKLTKYLFSLITQQQITSKAKIKVTFPSEFDQTSIASNPSCMASSDSYQWKTVPCTFVTDSIILTLGSIKNQNMNILIQSPKNPLIYDMSSYFSICLMFDNTVSSCKKQFGKVVFPQAPTTQTTTLTSPNVTSLSSDYVGKASTYQFKFSTLSQYAAGNTIRITFPPGYTTTANPVCQMSGTYNQIIKTFVWPNQRSIQCQLVNKTIYTDEVIKVIGIYNPNYAGVFGNTQDGFIIQILEGTTTIVKEEMFLKMTITIQAGQMLGSITQANNFILSKSRYTFYLNLQNALASTDYIKLKMDDSWIFYQNQCSVVSGITLGSGSRLLCDNSTDGTYTYLNIYNFQSASITNQLVFNVFVGTPGFTGAYDVNIKTINPKGIMDQITLSVSLNQTYGSLDMLSINAITSNSKVPVAGTGPLQLTFFLNYNLPQTNVLTNGNLLLKIYPQIPKPSQSQNGVLKCYFYNTIPAKTCTWDTTTNSGYTLVTIQTPDTYNFQSSQIPITITTEGAVNQAYIGITIADKVTRYRFELEFYTQNNATTPTEVYYSEYIADAIQIPTITIKSLTKEINQYTGLRIDFTNPYNFVNPTLIDIRFKIQFLSGGGWATNLGYSADKIYKRFPCVFYYNDLYNSPTYDSHVKCDLYTYTTGPHASLTDVSSRGPYLIMYGFTNSLGLNHLFRLQLAKFLIGSSTGTDTKVRFSIIQQTPTMLTPYVQLYYYQTTVFTTVSQQKPTATANAVTVSISNANINQPTTHTNTLTTSSNAHVITYQYDIESTPSFTNKLITCSTSNNCVYFGYPVNWIIEYPSTATFPVSVSSSLSITNGIYAGTYAGLGRAYSSTSLTLFKGTFNIVYNPRAITNAYFYKQTSSNTLYKGADVYYTLYFTAITSTPANGFIRLIFGSGVTLSTQPYCSSTISLFVAQHGLLCVNENTSTLKIYNIQALNAGSQYTFTVRLKSDLTTGGSITPTVTIRTYYSLNVDYSIIDQKISHPLNQSETNYYVIPNQFTIENPKITYDWPRVNYIGSFIIRFMPSSASLLAANIIVQLPNHSWNGGIWTTPNNAVSDPLVCFINTQRVPCTYTLAPLRITLTAQNLISGAQNKITLTTQYLTENGIKHPSQGGQYICTLSFLTAASLNIQSTSFYHKVLPPKLRRFTISSAVNDIGVQNMFSFELQVGSVYPRAYSDGTTYSRILIEFPTVDALGNSLFASDLGGYTKTGQYVGCYMYPYTNVPTLNNGYVKSESNNLRCRLIKSQVSGQPAIVQVINCGAFSNTAYRMRLRMARIFNPSRAVTSVPISIRINHVTASNNDVTQLYYDSFDLFMNSQNPAPIADWTRGCDYYTTDFASNGQGGDLAYLRFFPRRKDGSVTRFYYVIKLSIDFTLANVEAANPSSCDDNYHYQCMVFPDIGYIIIDSFSDNVQVRLNVYLPRAISQPNYNIPSLVWQANRYKGIDYITMNMNCQDDYRGSLASVISFYSVGNSNQQRQNKRKLQVRVSFQLTHAIPAGGSIQVVFPSQVTAAYPHCRSMANIGSQLYAKNQIQNGQIGCMVQVTSSSLQSWVVTQFQPLGTNKDVILMGFVDIAGSQNSNIGISEVLSYNSTHSTNIRANGFIIDYKAYSGSDVQLYVGYYQSMNFDTQISLQETLALRVSYVGPLQFKFRLGTSLPGPNQGKIRVRIPRNSIWGISGGFSYDSTKKVICQLKNILTYEQYGCIVTSITNDATVGSQNILFEMVTSSTLATTQTYTLLLKTHTGVDPSQGLIFPTVAGTYKIDVSFDADLSGQFNIHNHLYLEVYGTSFTTLSVRSFVTLCGERNIIWVKLTPTTTISQTDSIVIEIPTKSSNGLTIFTNDLGTGVSDGGNIKTDIVSGTFSNGFMNCRLFHGDQTFGKSARIICGNFLSSITNAQLLHFAFKVVNPTVSPQVSIPFFIYSQNTNTMFKSNFNTVENAVYLRNTFIVTTISQYAYFNTPAYKLQTQGTYLQLTSRNSVDMSSEDFYTMFFNFPLRNNGAISNGCKRTDGTNLGTVYYHENLWVIICDFTTNTLVAPTTTSNNLQILGFYTPWFYLQSSQKQVYAYHLSSLEYSYKIILSDGFPQMNPKQTSTGSLTFTAVNQASGMYKGARDDYIINFRFDSASSVDISYMKLIAVILPHSSNADYVILGKDCVEGPNSGVQIQECWLVPGTRIIWIRPVIKTSYTSNLYIQVITRDLAIRNPSIGSVNINTFTVKFYSWENVTESSLSLDPINNNNYCFLIIDSLSSSVMTYNNNPTSYSVGTFTYLKIPHQRYYKQTPYSPLTHYAPFQFMFKTDNTFPTVSGSNFHQITVNYGTAFTANSQLKIRDLQVFRPVCYLANNRIRKCNLDTANNAITMLFQFGLAINTAYHVQFAIVDPRNPDIYGFLANSAISSIIVSYKLAASPTIYYTQTQKFPTLYSLPTGITQGPFRGIVAAAVQYGHALSSQLNSINLRLTFNRTDITGLVFQFPLIDSNGAYLYDTAGSQSAAFLGVQDGSTYPCGNNGLSAGGNVKCIIKLGTYSDLTIPTRIIMTDFTYVSSMNCRFVFINPNNVGSYFSVKVKAFGGAKTSTNLYGQQYMGEWQFDNIFQIQSGSPSLTSYQASNFTLPTKSPWRNDTTHYVFSSNNNMNSGRMSIASILTYDSGDTTYTDKQFCIATLGNVNNYDDLLEYTKITSGRVQRYSYFIRTWQSTTNLQAVTGGGWPLNYIKCKFYALSMTAYWFFADTSVQIATNTFLPSHGFSLESAGGNPINRYYDQTHRLDNGANANIVFQLDLTPMISAFTDLFFRNNDKFVLTISFSSAAWWSSITRCDVLAGFISTSIFEHSYCQINSGTLVIRNFKGFETDPTHTSSDNIRVRIRFLVGSLTASTSGSRSMTVGLYANYDSYFFSYQAISKKTINIVNNCYYPDTSTSTCYYTHSNGAGNFELKRVTDTFIQAVFYSSSAISYGSSPTHHQFDIKFNNFNYGSSCSVSSFDIQISNSQTPGTGRNNSVIVPTSTPVCAGDRVRIQFNNTVFSTIWDGASSLANNNQLDVGQYLILYITIAPAADKDSQVLHREYVFASAAYNYYVSSQNYAVRKVAFLPSQPLTSAVTISTISSNRDGITQFSIQTGTLNTDVGSQNSGFLLLAEFNGGNSWTGTSDPFGTYVNTAVKQQYIQCKCISTTVPITISASSPYVNAKCIRRLPTTTGTNPFNAYAILIDFEANKNEYVKCYFPQFKTATSMSFSIQLKVVYGDSYPPDLTDGKQYGSVFRTTSNTLTFSAGNPTMTLSSFSPSQTPTFYGTGVTVGTTVTSTYTISGSWGGALSSPYIYINYRKGGPVPANVFCSDSNIFFQCRVYNKLLNLVVAKLKSGSATAFTMSRGSSDIFYPSSQYNDGSLFNTQIYVGSGQWSYYGVISKSQSSLLPISTNTFNVYSDLYSTSRSTYNTIITISMSISGKTLYRNSDTGSKLIVTFSGITVQRTSCQIWVQNEPNVELKCIITAGLITIFSQLTDYTTNNLIFVTFGVENPQTTSITFSMVLYDYFFSSSRYSIVISRSTTYTIDNSWSSNTQISKQRIQMFPFESRYTLISNAPLRVRFKLPSSISYNSATPSYSGMIRIINQQISYSTAYLIYFKEYRTYANMIQQTEGIKAKADSYSSSSSTLDIVVPKSMVINQAYYYQLIIMPIGINAAGCAALGCPSQSGFQQTNFEDINIIAYANPNPGTISIPSQQVQKLYRYESSSRIALNQFYILCAQPKQTSLYFKFSTDFTSSTNYPSHYIQFILWDLPSSTFGSYLLRNQVPCQLSSNFASISNRKSPACVLAEADNVIGFIKIRIINIGTITAGVYYWVTFDDITLPNPGTSSNTAKFDMSIAYVGPSNVRHQNHYKQVFLIDATNTVSASALTISFQTPATKQYGISNTGSISFNWPFDTTSSGYQSKVSFNVNGGFGATWPNIDSVTFLDTSGTYQLLWVNKALNKFVFAVPQKSIAATVMNITALQNPYPYQQQVYNVGTNIEINFYNNYYQQSYQTFSQPSFSIYTKSPASLVSIDQNLPSNTFDIFPSTNKIGSGALTTLRLGINIQQTAANIVARDLNIFQVEFTAGVSYLDECKVARNNTMYVNPRSTCTTIYSGGTWHVFIYYFKQSQLDTFWWLQVVGTFTSTTITYVSRLKASNGVVQYQSTFPVTMSNYYSTSKSIPTTLNWLNRKYVYNFFENQYRYLEAVSGQSTPYFRMRLSITRAYNGENDYSYVYTQSTSVFNSQNSATNLICQLLPAVSAERDFSIGVYAQCRKLTQSNSNIYYQLKGPIGGYSVGDYLLQIQQPNVVTTRFNTATSPRMHTMYYYEIPNGDTSSQHYDAMNFYFKQFFTSAQILHTSTTVNDYDTLTITYTPKTSVIVGSTTQQTVLLLQVSGLYHNYDGGAIVMYTSDGKTISSGARYSSVVSNPNNNEITTIQFAQYTQKMAPLRYALAKMSAFTAGTSYTWRVPLIKNPSTAFIALRYNLTLISYASSNNYGIIVNQHECINQYFTQSDTSTSFNPTVINTNRNIQVTSAIDLSIGLDSYSLAQWDVVMFKLDNSKLGLIPNFAAGNDTTNYNYFYFNVLNVIMAEKKTAGTITTVGIGAASSSLSYQRDFAFNWVKIYDTSNVPTTTNPKLIRYGTPPTQTLNYFTTYSAKTLTKIQGSQAQGSTAMYRLDFTVPIIPDGGEIQVVFDNTKISSNSNARCRVRTGFVKSSNANNVMRCFRMNTGFRIIGFTAVTNASPLSLFFMIKSILPLTAQNVAVNIYGIQSDLTSIITQVPNAVTVTHPSSSFPTTLLRHQQLKQFYYSSIYSQYFYELQGTLNLRNNNFASGSSIQITNPLDYSGNLRFIIKRNDSNYVEWTQLPLTSSSGNVFKFTIPSQYITDLSMSTGNSFIWKFTPYDTSYYNSNRENGFVSQSFDGVKFLYQGFQSSSVTQAQYFDFVSDPKPKVLTIVNRHKSATRKTMLQFSFYLDLDIVAGDWIQMTFDTSNLINNMFSNDIQNNPVTGQIYRLLDCLQTSNQYISTGRMRCIMYYGDNLANPPKPARLVIPLQRTITQWTSPSRPTTINFLLANVKNPDTVGMNVGVQMNIMGPCRNMHNKNCSRLAAKGFYVTSASTITTVPSTSFTFTPSSNNVLDTNVNHVFTFTLSASIGTNDVIYIVYPENFQGVMPSTCSASGYSCYAFPKPRWIVLIPTGTISSGSTTISLVSSMNNGYYTQAFSQNFVITVSRSTGTPDLYNILQNPFITIKRTLTNNQATSMTIQTTQTPNIWLRNYANTAIFTLNNIFMDSRIKAIYLKAPASDVVSWEFSYCNASITNTIVNTYPLRFTCSVFTANTTNPVLQIIPEIQDLGNYAANAASWSTQPVRVHAKFTISAFSTEPTLYVTMPVTSGTFNAYGSVSTTSVDPKYYLSQCSNTVQISQHQVPIISDITFNQKSFAYRVARVNNKQVFYLLLKPRVSVPIAQMNFITPVQFDYPGVFQHDNCFMIGRTKQDQQSCKQSREGGRTIIKVAPQNYNNEVKIIQLGSVAQQNWFTAPSLPGNFYNMTVQLYGIGGVLLEKQTIDISPVYGQYFNIPSITINNIQDGNIAESVYDISFVTGSLQIPPGAVTTATTMTSQLRFIFESYNADNPTNVFKEDLGTGLKEGDQVGCVIRSGITALLGKRLVCILHIGTNSTDKPMITILNYDYINPSTTIRVSFGGIQSLNQINVNTISMAVRIFYTDINSSTYLYLPTPKLPQATNNTVSVADRNSLGYVWKDYWYMTTSYSGNNIVRKTTTFTLYIQVPYSYPFNGFQYSSTAPDSDYILLKFKPKYIIDPYNAVTITCSGCTYVQAFFATGIIRFRHNLTMSGSAGTSITFYNFPSSAFTVSAIPVKVDIEIYSGYRLYTFYNSTITSRTVEKCSLFSFGVLSVSSLNGGQIGVTYTFSLITNHYIPKDGAISITIPSSYGNMVSNGVTCTLIGFSSTNAYCLIQTPSRVDIYLNGSELSTTSSYKVVLSGLQNPNQPSSSLFFLVTSYYNSNIYLGYKICQNSVSPPAITVKAVRVCTLSFSSSFVNQNFNAQYTFVLSCNDLFRGDSTLYISLPDQFSSNNTQSVSSCSSLQSTTLLDNKCYLGYINGTFMLWTKLQATSQTSLTLIINLVNPTNNTYSSSAYVQSKGVTYAQSQTAYLTILSSSYTTASSNSAFLMNSPKQAGLLATYIFRISPISSYTPNNLAIQFPTNFYLNQPEMTIGITTTNDSQLFSSLTYDNVQKLINNVSSVNRVFLKGYCTFEVSIHYIFMKNISQYLSTSQWTYVFIRGIKNPGQYQRLNFTIAYYIDSQNSKALQWVLQAPLTYYISSPPQYLSINSVSVSDYDLLYPSVYTFKFSGASNVNIGIAGSKLSYVIVLPTFYRSTVWANGNLVCKFAQLPNSSPCQNYQSQIIVTETFPSNFNSLTLSITTLLNPSLQTYCNTTDVTLLEQTFFRIRIIEVDSNKFMFESSSIVDASNCLKFYSIRIPISLQHSLVMVAGLAYNITYGITKPASNLKIRAKTTANGFTFSPDTVEFNDYYSLKKSATLYLRSDIAPGNYTITYEKFQSEQRTYFRNILPTTVQVISASSSSNFIAPTITIPSITISTSGAPVVVPVLFSVPSSTQMSMFIKIAEQNNQTLSQYSPHLSNFSLTPRIITIVPQKSDFSFTMTQGLRVVPPPITLQFTLTSVYSIIHNLTTPTITVCFDRDPTYNVLFPPLRVRLTQFATSCNLADVGKPITNIMISNQTSQSSASSMKPQILKITTSNIASSSATVSVNTRTGGNIYYLVLDSGYPTIDDVQTIVALAQTRGFIGTAVSSAQTVYINRVAQINYIATINLSKLSSSTSYKFYAVLSSELGNSTIKSVQFKTNDLSKGVLMKLTFNDIVSNLDIVKSLERIIRITPLRIKVLTSTYNLQKIRNNTNQYKNSPKYIYEVVIAPDPTNDTMTPLSIVQRFLQNSTSKGLFAEYLPDWDSSANVQYYQLRSVKPRIAVNPKPQVINLYNATFSIKFWQRANIYAIIVEQQERPPETMQLTQSEIKAVRVSQLSSAEKARSPSSLQIRSGKNIDNTQTTAYKKYSGMTDEKGNGNIFFDDLKPGSYYQLFITSSSYLPYEPTLLWQDNQVIRIRFPTLHNPNLMKSNRNIDQLKKYQPQLGAAIERFVKNQANKNNRNGSSSQQ